MAVLGNPLGIQLLAEIWECNEDKLNGMEGIEKIMTRAANTAVCFLLGSPQRGKKHLVIQ